MELEGTVRITPAAAKKIVAQIVELILEKIQEHEKECHGTYTGGGEATTGPTPDTQTGNWERGRRIWKFR